MEYRTLEQEELCLALFQGFRRHQVVNQCWRREHGRWVVREAPFIDDWGPAEYEILVRCLRNTLKENGFVYGAFTEDGLKGFVSVEGTPMGSRGQYLDLTSIHVSEDTRRLGTGRTLFQAAAAFARQLGAEKLYISAHSAVESQAFYRSMGCVEAEEYQAEHVEQEPFDCQLEYRL